MTIIFMIFDLYRFFILFLSNRKEHTKSFASDVQYTRREGGGSLKQRGFSGDVKIGVAGCVSLGIWVITLQLPERFVFRMTESFSNSGDGSLLLLAAIFLVVLNAIRAIPLYIGCFFLGEGPGRWRKFLPLFMIPLSYALIELFSGNRSHHFGMPAIMGILTVLFLQLLIRNVRGHFNRTAALSLFVFSFQWLNMVPLLTPYGFGRGELSLTIKRLADISDLTPFLDLTSVMDFLGLGGFAVTFIGALMATALLINIDQNARQLRRLMEQNEALAVLREGALRARMLHEIQSLVHDLRRPLTSIHALADVLTVVPEEPEARKYAEKIGSASESMSRMIGEILREEGRSPIDARELLNYAMSQTSPLLWHHFIKTDLDTIETVRFFGNRIRISRALVNLMENAAHAAEEIENPEIIVKYYVNGNFISFSIRDNGPGIPEDFQTDSSRRGSIGLGLAVAQNVAENHGGSFVLRNCPEGGAEALFSLPLEGSGKEGDGK
jgi:signal transduction histidine kinase